MTQRTINLDRLAGRSPKRNLLDPNPDAPEMAAPTPPKPEPLPSMTANVLLRELNEKLSALGCGTWRVFEEVKYKELAATKSIHNPVASVVDMIRLALVFTAGCPTGQISFDPALDPKSPEAEFTNDAVFEVYFSEAQVELIRRKIAALTRETCMEAFAWRKTPPSV